MRIVLILLAFTAPAFGQINLNSPVPMERDDHAKAATSRRAAPKAAASEATETPWTWDGESWTRTIRVKKVATARSVPQSPFVYTPVMFAPPAVNLSSSLTAGFRVGNTFIGAGIVGQAGGIDDDCPT